MAEATAVKKISLNLPTDLVEALQAISAVSNVTFTELLTAGLQVVKTGYEAEAAGKLVVIINQDGQTEQVLGMPKHGLQTLTLVMPPSPAPTQGENPTRTTPDTAT